jgi:hypothetical protein
MNLLIGFDISSPLGLVWWVLLLLLGGWGLVGAG